MATGSKSDVYRIAQIASYLPLALRTKHEWQPQSRRKKVSHIDILEAARISLTH